MYSPDKTEGISDPFSKWNFNNPSSHGPMGPSRKLLKKPVICVVQGFAVAGGLELALMCDLTVAHENSTFGVFCRSKGVPLIDGGTIRLAKVIGLNRARDMILTGREVSGKEAYEWGLVNRLAREDELMSTAIRLAHSITQHPELCMLSDRDSLQQNVFRNFEQDLNYEFENGKCYFERIKLFRCQQIYQKVEL
jgi:enoyl-CoA hydratase